MFHNATLLLCALGAMMSSASVHASSPPLEKVQVPSKLMRQLKSFEPSSALYLSDLGQYVISSDDTDKKESPYLFLMNERGEVNENPMRVQGLDRMTDIESISQDQNGNMYLLSSTSINKNGKNKVSRNLFVKVSRRGTKLSLLQQVELRPLLVEAIRKSGLPEFAHVSRDLANELDVESHFILNGELYIGLKNPQPRRNQALIMNLGSLEVLLTKQIIEKFSLWRKIDFSSYETDCLLSDMQIQGDELYLTTTSDNGEPGNLWHFQISKNELTLLETFNGVKPEGIALRDDSVMIVFDQGSDQPLFHLGRRF